MNRSYFLFCLQESIKIVGWQSGWDSFYQNIQVLFGKKKIKMISPFPYQWKRKFHLFVNFIRMYSLQLLFVSSPIEEKVVSGIVKEMGKEFISIKSDTGFLRLRWEDILDIQIEGLDLYES